MSIPSLFDLYIDETYPRLVQTNDTRTEFADGLGNPITFGTTPTGSLLTTASATGNTITFTKGDGSQFPVTVSGGTVTGDYVTTASFNSYTSSVVTTSSFNTFTSSIVTTSSFNTFTGSYNSGSFTGSFTGALTGTSSWAFNAATASSIEGGKATHIPYFKTDTTLATSSLYQSGSSTIIINQDAATSEAPEALYVWQPIQTDNGYNVISGKGALNNYLQLNIKNTDPGINASSDVVATANNGNEYTNYIDMGINSSGFNGSIGKANDAYLYSTGSDLHIGNATPNKPVQFFAGGIDTDANRKFQLNTNNQHNMTGSLDISGSLAIRNLITSSVSNVLTYNPSTGQVYYTASSAIGGGGSGNPVAILDEGSTLTSAVTSINFTGDGVVAAAAGNAVTVTISGATIDTSKFATTGSNVFKGNQTVTGSLFTSGSNTLIGNTTLTGSLKITGSTTQTGDNTLVGNTLLSGSITISGSLGTSNPTVRIYGDTQHNGHIRFDPVTTNIDTSISASYIYVSGSTQDLYFSQNGSGYNNVTRLRWLEGALYTGVLRGGNMTSTPGSNTFTVASGSGIIVTMNASLANEPYPTVKQVSWPTQTLPITYSGSAKITYVGISNTGTVTQQTEAWGSTDINQWDNAISLGVVLTLSGSVSTGVFNAPQISYGGFQKTDDFFRAFGPLKVSGHTLLASGSTLGIKKAGGSSYREGANYVIDPNHPSTVIESAINTSKIYRYYLSGSTPVIDTGVASAGYTVIDPTKYVDTTTGQLVTVSGNNSNQWRWTIQRVFWVPNSPTNAFIVYYGNAEYTTLVDAKNGIDTEPFSEAPNTALNAILVGYILVRKGCTDLSDTTGTNAVLIQGGLFRSVGGVGGSGTSAATTLGSLSDVALANLSTGDLLVYNAQGGSQWNNAKQLNGSYGLTGSLVVTQNISASSFTGSLFGTASWASNVVTASYITSSFFTGTNAALSASYASTASYVVTAQTASYVTSSNIVGTVLSSSYAATASLLLGTVANATNATNASSGSDFVITSTLKIDKTLVDYGEQLNTGTGTYPLFDFATGSYTSAHGKYTLFNGTNARAGEFITVWNGTNINYTDVSTTDIGSTSNISLQSVIVGSNIRINAITLSSNWTVKMLATFI